MDTVEWDVSDDVGARDEDVEGEQLVPVDAD